MRANRRSRSGAPLPTEGLDPDAALVAQFLVGDRAAFDALVKRHQAAVRCLVLRYVKSEVDAKGRDCLNSAYRRKTTAAQP